MNPSPDVSNCLGVVSVSHFPAGFCRDIKPAFLGTTGRFLPLSLARLNTCSAAPHVVVAPSPDTPACVRQGGPGLSEPSGWEVSPTEQVPTVSSAWCRWIRLISHAKMPSALRRRIFPAFSGRCSRNGSGRRVHKRPLLAQERCLRGVPRRFCPVRSSRHQAALAASAAVQTSSLWN